MELAGGDIRNIVLAAAYAAVAGQARASGSVADAKVGMRHIMDALRREYLKLGRRLAPAPR